MENRSGQVLAVALLFISLTCLAVGLRCYVRCGMLHSFGYDDWIMLVAQLFFTMYIICQIGGVVNGTGRHLDSITPAHARIALEFWFLCELFYILTASVLKIAIGFFLLRVASKKPHCWVIRIVVLGTIVFGTAYFFTALFQCSPISAWWKYGAGSHYCMSPQVIVGITYAASVINSLADWVFAILPVFIVWDLEMSKRQKAMVAGILALAAVGSAATIIRIPSISNLLKTTDFLYDTVDIAIWSTVETGIGITAGCMATLRPLLQLVLKGPGWRSNRAARSGLHRSGQSKFSAVNNASKRLSSKLCLRSDGVGNATVAAATAYGYPSRNQKDPYPSDEKLYSGDGISKSVEISLEEITRDIEGESPSRTGQSVPAARHDFMRISERHQPW